MSLQKKSAGWLLLLCVCALSSLLLLGGKGGKKDEKPELRFWHSIGTYNKDLLSSLIESYNQKNRQTAVRGVFQGSETDLYLKLLSPETRPDIVQVSVQFLPDLIEKNQLVDLTGMIPGKLKEDMPEKFWSSVSAQERIYGIPFLYSVQLLYANQHVLRNAGVRSSGAPGSWSDVLAWSEKIRTNQGEKWPLFIPMESVVQFLNFVQSYTGEPVIRDGRLRIDSDQVIGAMQFLRNLVYENRFMPAKLSIDEGENLFLGGNLGIMSASSSLLVYTESNLPYDMNVWELPASDRVHPLVSGTCLAILRSSARTEKESYRFIEYLTDYENAIKWHTHTGNPAIRRSVKGSLDLLVFYEDNPNHMVSVNQMEEGRIFTPSTEFLQVSDIIKAALEAIMLKGESPAAVLRNAQTALDRLDVRF